MPLKKKGQSPAAAAAKRGTTPTGSREGSPAVRRKSTKGDTAGPRRSSHGGILDASGGISRGGSPTPSLSLIGSPSANSAERAFKDEIQKLQRLVRR